MTYSWDGTGYFMFCTLDTDSAIFFERLDTCFERIVFRLKYYDGNLDLALSEDGLVKGSEGIYISNNNGKIKILPTHATSNNKYTGLFYLNNEAEACEIDKTKEENSKKFSTYYIYFSNGEVTLRITSNGKYMNDLILEKIMKSFKFN